ncbi:MAG: O-antigen/teichoic acid export membrane protein [Patiriisocius sp.]|jgi:O-antigen/teichoic acid export membrane protein
MIIKGVKKIRKSKLLKNTLVLSAGQFVSQILLLIGLPVITRLYTPEDFGLLAAFVAAANILSSFFVLKFDQALVLPESDSVAKYLLNFISKIPLVFFLVLIGPFIFFKSYLSELFKIKDSFVYLVPVFAMLISYGQIFLAYRNRQEKYQLMSYSRVLLVISTIILQIGFIYFYDINNGLVYGLLGGQFIYFIVIGFTDIKELSYFIKDSKNKYRVFFIKYKDFPKYTLPSSFLNISTIQLIPIILLFYFGAEVAGLVFIIQKILGAPFGLLGESIKQVVYKKMSTLGSNRAGLYKLTTQVVIVSFVFVGLLMAVIYITLPYLFKYLFSPEYYQSIEFFLYLIPFYLFQLAVSPILSVVFVMKRQKEYFIWEIFRFFIVISALVFGGMYHDVFTTLLLYSTSQALLYTIIFIFICYWQKNFFLHLDN